RGSIASRIAQRGCLFAPRGALYLLEMAADKIEVSRGDSRIAALRKLHASSNWPPRFGPSCSYTGIRYNLIQ
ncbi:MAG: hypothetical protein WBQ55_25015, partial [Xanthobacteraceae bacterium]